MLKLMPVFLELPEETSIRTCIHVALCILQHLEHGELEYYDNDVNRKVIEIANHALEGTGVTIADIFSHLIAIDPEITNEDMKISGIEKLLK